MDMISLLLYAVVGGLLFDKFDKNKADKYGDSEGNIQEAQPIPLTYISGFTTSILDPKVVNQYRQQTVGDDSYLTMVQTSSLEFLNIQPDTVVPPRFKDSKNPPSDYFFTLPNNNEKIWTFNVPEIYYVLRVKPATSNYDTIQVVGSDADSNKAVKILQDKMTAVVERYNRLLADTDVIGGGNQGENAQDDIGEGEGSISGGFGLSMAQPQEVAEEDEKFEAHYMYGKNGEAIFVESYEEHLSLDSKGFVHEKPVKKIVRDNGSVIGKSVNLGGSPYAGL